MNLSDLLTLASLTAAINKLPAVPGQAGALGLFEEKGITSTTVVVDIKEGRLSLVSNTSRDADPQKTKTDPRNRKTFEVPHLPTSGQLLPGQVQNVAAFGQDGVPMAQAQMINDELQRMKRNLEATREWQMMGALQGKILDADGSVIYDLYEIFGVQQKTFNLVTVGDNTTIRKTILGGKRWVEQKTTGVQVTGVKAFVGPDYFDALTGSEEVKDAYKGWQAAQDRIGGDMRSGFTFGGIEHIECNVTVSGKPFVKPDEAAIFPVARGAFAMYNAPANYNETVNTLGQAYYAKAEERRMNKGYDLEAQSNPLALCFFPEALVRGKLA